MKRILKGILLWLTIFSVALYLIGAESLEIESVLIWTVINIVLLICCKYALSLREFNTLSGYRYFHRKFNL